MDKVTFCIYFHFGLKPAILQQISCPSLVSFLGRFAYPLAFKTVFISRPERVQMAKLILHPYRQAETFHNPEHSG